MSTDFRSKTWFSDGDVRQQIVQLTRSSTQALSEGQTLFALDQISEAYTLWNLHLFYDSKLGTSVQHTLGNVLFILGRYDEAFEHYNYNHMNLRYINEEIPLSTSGASEYGLGNVLNELGRYPEALERYEESLGILQQTYGGTTHPKIAAVFHGLGNVLVNLGHYDKAFDYFRQSLAINRDFHGDTLHPDIAANLHGLGNCLSSLGRYEETLEYYKQSLEIRQIVYGDRPHPDIAASLHGLGNVLNNLGRYEETLEYYKQSLEIRQIVYGDRPHPDIAASLYGLGNVLNNLRRFELSRENFEQSVVILRQIHGEIPHPSVAAALHGMANALLDLGRYEQALEQYEASLEMKRQFHKESMHTDVSASLHGLGNVLVKLERYDEALEHFEESLVILRQLFSMLPHPDIVASLQSLGNVFVCLGQHEQALERYLEARQMLSHVNTNVPREDRLQLTASLGRQYLRLAKPDQGIPLLIETLTLHLTLQHNLSGVLTTAEVRLNNLERLTDLRVLLESIVNDTQIIPQVAAAWLSFKGSASALDSTLHLIVQLYPYLEPLYITRRDAHRALSEVLGTPDQNRSEFMSDEARQAALQNKFQTAFQEARRRLEQAEAALRSEAKEVFDLAQLSLEGVLNALRPGEVYLDYALLENLAFVFVLESDPAGQPQVRLVPLGPVDLLEQDVEALLGDLVPPENADLASVWNPLPLAHFRTPEAASARLFDHLIRPLGLDPGVPLVIAPDGVLNFVPFDLLYDVQLEQALLKRNPCRPIPSARDLVRLHQARTSMPASPQPGRGRAVLLGHPAYGATPDEIGQAFNQDFRQAVSGRLHPDELLLEFAVLCSGGESSVGVLALRKHGSAHLDAFCLTHLQTRSNGSPALLPLEHLQTLLEQGEGKPDWRVSGALLHKVLDGVFEVWDGWSPQRLTVLTSPTFPTLDFASVPHPLDGQPLSSHYDPLEQPGGLADWLETPRAGASKAPEFTTTLHQILRPQEGGVTYQGAAWTGLFDLRSSGLMGREHFPGRTTPETAFETAPETAPEVFSHFEAIHPLPQTLPQVLNIARALHALEPQVFVGPAASLATLRHSLSLHPPEVLHLTTHGVQLAHSDFARLESTVQDRFYDPLHRAFLLLAGADHLDRSRLVGDGLLSAFDLAGLELRGTRLVVLAACETGLGDALAAEGVWGLVQGAFLGGAQAVMSSLWKVEVTATTALMQEFYTAWQAGHKPPDQVLSTLKGEWLERGVAPFYWAAFTLSGG